MSSNRETQTRRKRGSKLKGSIDLHVQIPSELLVSLDAWIAQQLNPMSRPEAIRSILETHFAQADSSVGEWE